MPGTLAEDIGKSERKSQNGSLTISSAAIYNHSQRARTALQGVRAPCRKAAKDGGG